MEDKRDVTRRTIQEVKERSGGAENVALFYGLNINSRTHRAVCPFHPHKNGTPDENLSFYGSGFLCFQCGVKGSALDYVQMLFGYSTVTESARRLDDDMHMGLFRKGPQIRKSQAQYSQEAYSFESEQAEEQLGFARFIYRIQYNALEKTLWRLHDAMALDRSLSHEEYVHRFAEWEKTKSRFDQLPEPDEMTATQAAAFWKGGALIYGEMGIPTR